ncbi:MAG: SPFH domain-containing protein [Synechococcales bacterium]|nr:SPFH domain-containing protein [Synechococcales bacterium]
MGQTLTILAFLIIGYTVGSVRIINQGYEAIVERLGRYHRKLTPGLNFIVPMLDQIVWYATTREQILDFDPQEAITKDNVNLKVDAIVYWRILELQQTYYTIENIEEAIKNVVMTSLRSLIGRMALEDTYSSREDINRNLLEQLDDATATWGVKVTRVEIQNIILPQTVRDSLERERAALSEKRATIEAAEGKRQAAIAEAQGTVESARLIAEALGSKVNPQTVLRYLVAQRYVDANFQLGKSNNSKIVFMDPGQLSEAMAELIGPDVKGED